MKTAMRRMLVLAGTTLASIPAWADVPASFDRVPTDALVVAAIRDLDQFDARVGKLFKDLNVPQDAGEMALAFKLMKTPGLNRKGSLALALMADPEKAAKPAAEDDMGDEGPGPMVLVVPVSDAAAFCKAMGGELGKGVVELKGPEGDESPFDGPAFAKDLGGGYLALGPKKEIVEKFDGAAGRLAAHKTALGAVGGRIADAGDTIIVFNIPALSPQMKEGFEGFKQQMQMMMMMGGQADSEKTVKFVEGAFEAFMRDARVGVVGMGLDDAGVWLDFGAQFKEGSEAAKLCQTKGKAPALAGKLTDQPYLAMFSLDTSGQNMKQIMGEFAKLSDGKTPSFFDNFTKGIDKLDGVGVVIGQTPGMLSGGLLANGVTYAQTSDPAGYTKLMRDSITAMNGKTENGVSFKTSYEAGASDFNGVKADKYSAQMTVDPNNDPSGQAQRMMIMLYGPTGMGGFVATVDNAVIMTMAQNSPLMTAAIDAAKGKKTLAENSDFKNAGSKLQGDRAFEGYLNVKPLLDLAAMFMGGGGNVPASLAPIAFGMANSDGGMHSRLYVPKTVIAAIKDAVGGAGAGEEEEGGAPAEKDAKPPRF